MKFTLSLFYLLLLSVTNGYAQYLQTKMVVKDMIPEKQGSNVIIKGREYTFPCEIINYDLDSVNKELLLLFRTNDKRPYSPARYLTLFDLKTNKLRWQHDILQGAGGYVFAKDRLIHFNGQRMYCYNRHTGERIWDEKASKLPSYGWTYAVEKDSQIVLYTRRGINGINLYNGQYWNYRCKTDQDEYVKVANLEKDAALNAAGMLLSAAGGVAIGGIFYAAVDNTQKLGDAGSNILTDDAHMYFTDKEYMHCIDMKGETIWKTALHEDSASNANIVFHGDNIFMVNYAYSSLNHQPIWRGTCFIASYNKITGQRNYVAGVPALRFIISSKIVGDTAYLLSENKWHQYNIKTGKEAMTILLKDTLSPYSNIAWGDDHYVTAAAGHTLLNVAYPGEVFVSLDNDKTARYPANGTSTGTIPSKDISTLLYHNPTLKAYRFGDSTSFVSNNITIATIKTTSPYILGNTLIDIRKNSVTIMDIHGLLAL